MTTQRRKTRWVDTLVSNGVLNAGQVLVDLLAAISVGDLRGLTVTRMIVSLWMSPAIPLAAGDGRQSLDVGVGVTSLEAFTAGVVSDPNVATDEPARGWLWRDRAVVHDDGTNLLVPTRVQGDFRGQRRIEGGKLFIVFNNGALQGATFTVQVQGIVRCLLLL